MKIHAELYKNRWTMRRNVSYFLSGHFNRYDCATVLRWYFLPWYGSVLWWFQLMARDIIYPEVWYERFLTTFMIVGLIYNAYSAGLWLTRLYYFLFP